MIWIGDFRDRSSVYMREDARGRFYYTCTLLGFDHWTGKSWEPLNSHQSEIISAAIERSEEAAA